jgi:DNA repair exonuclease SbcCD ATPase subunit
MSRAETFMLVALGFATGLLLALLFGRLAWHAAVRVGSRRMQRQMPSSLAELQAERDRLRAESAMLSRKMEMRTAELKSQLVEQSAELTRERNRADILVDELKRRDSTIAEREQHVGVSQEQASHLEAELSTRTSNLQGAQSQLRDSQDLIARLKNELSVLTQALADRDGRIADLRKELAERPLRLESPVRHEQVSATDRLQRRIDELTALSREISEQRSSFNRERNELAALAAAAADLPLDTVESGEDTTSLDDVTNQERSIDRMLAKAERESRELAVELERLDALHGDPPPLVATREPTLPEPREASAEISILPAPVSAEQPQRGLANVVSLAARIRALQKNITG